MPRCMSKSNYYDYENKSTNRQAKVDNNSRNDDYECKTSQISLIDVEIYGILVEASIRFKVDQ